MQATKNKQELSFYSIPEFDEWKKQTENYKSWHIKYYKGLRLIFFEDSSQFSSLNVGEQKKPNAPLLNVSIFRSGLGTSTSKEAKEYFAEMERHRITFRYGGAEDDAAITLVSDLQTPLKVVAE